MFVEDEPIIFALSEYIMFDAVKHIICEATIDLPPLLQPEEGVRAFLIRNPFPPAGDNNYEL